MKSHRLLLAGVVACASLVAAGAPSLASPVQEKSAQRDKLAATDTKAAVAAAKAPLLALDRDFPDPDILKVGGTYYVYSTNSARNLPVASATNINGPWTVQDAEALPNLGAWATTGRTWAPDVSRRNDGKFLLYYTAHSISPDRQCIGAALADSPRGPFVPVGSQPLVCPAAEGGAIDASSFVESDGKRYLLYKNDGNAVGLPTTIWLQPVADDGITFTGSRVALVSNNDNEGWLVEAPVLVKHGGAYVLTYATGEYWNSTYATRYATAASVAGPYPKNSRALLSTAGFDQAVSGPGGADIIQESTGDHIVFHGVRDGGYRALYLAELGWAGDTPVVRGMRFRYEGESGALNHSVVRQNAAGASGGAVIAYIDYDDSWVDLRVFAPQAGGYMAHVGYANGSTSGGAGQTATHRVSVNGASIGEITYPFTGWDNWHESNLDVTLNQGWNTIRFGKGAWYTELDYVDLA